MSDEYDLARSLVNIRHRVGGVESYLGGSDLRGLMDDSVGRVVGYVFRVADRLHQLRTVLDLKIKHDCEA